MSERAILGTIRASSWPRLFDCALRFYYQDICHMRLPVGGKGRTGTALHRATAIYDQHTVEGSTPSIEEAKDKLVSTIRVEDEPVAWDDDFGKDKAEKIGLLLVDSYVREIVPTHEWRAVEVNCDALDVTTPDGVIRLCGSTDRVRITEDGREGISDLKSGANAVSADGKVATKGHHLQTGIYRILAEATLERTLDAPDEIIGLQTNGKARVGCGEIKDSRRPLVGDEDSPGMIEIAAKMLKSGTFPPNPQSYLCSVKYCAGWSRCKFHD